MKISNMLVVGAFQPGAIENFFVQGFIKNGLEVFTYNSAEQYFARISKNIIHKAVNKLAPDYLCRVINEGLLQFLKDKKFDVILVFKGMELFPETVRQMKDHTVLLANYNADHPFIFFFPGSGNSRVLESIRHYDIYFSYASTIVSQLQSKYNKVSFRIPFGYDSHFKRTGRQGGHFPGDKFLFIGAYDIERATYLEKLGTADMQIYGEEKWRTRTAHRPRVKKAYMNRALYGGEYTEAIRDAAGIINLLRKQNIIEDSHNMRTFEVPGFGGLLLSQRTSEQLEFFEEGKEAIYFESAEDLVSKMDFLGKNQSLVNRIKKAGFERSQRSGYSYEQRSSELLVCLQNIF